MGRLARYRRAHSLRWAAVSLDWAFWQAAQNRTIPVSSGRKEDQSGRGSTRPHEQSLTPHPIMHARCSATRRDPPVPVPASCVRLLLIWQGGRRQEAAGTHYWTPAGWAVATHRQVRRLHQAPRMHQLMTHHPSTLHSCSSSGLASINLCATAISLLPYLHLIRVQRGFATAHHHARHVKNHLKFC